MRRLAVLRLVVLVSALLVAGSVTDTARAGGDGFATSVIDCFHPGAQFTTATYARGRGRHAWSGWIGFREGHSHAEAVMSFVMDTKTQNGDSVYRITPITDDGSQPPAPGCYLREWQAM